MLCFFMFLLMTVSSTPMDLVQKQASKSVTEMMSQPLSQALFQNKTFLSELAKADPGTLNTILGLLNDLLGASIAASIAFTTDVDTALVDETAKTVILATATNNQTNANNAKIAADLAFTEATSDFDAAVTHHTAMKDELADKQPGVRAESGTLRRTIDIVRTLLPESAQPQNFQWDLCAAERGTCTCSTTVRYAVNPSESNDLKVTDDMNGKDSILCDNAHFSDPDVGTLKNCYCAQEAN